MSVKVLPDETLWVRLALTKEQIEQIGNGSLTFAGTAEVQYVSKHDIGGLSNMEIRIKEISLTRGAV